MIRKTYEIRGGANFDTGAIIRTLLEEVYQTMPYAKYICSRACGSLQEDFKIYSYNFFGCHCITLEALHPRVNPDIDG
jgi:hypothetical protein